MAKIKFSKQKLEKIAQQYQLADVFLFGSKILGFDREGSDLDIAARFQNGLPSEKERGKIYGDLFSDLSSCFEGEKIDLVFVEEVPLHFQYKILSEGKMIYSRDLPKLFNFEEKIFNLYRDYKFFIDEYFSGVLQKN